MKIRFMLGMITILLLSACTQEGYSAEQEELRERIMTAIHYSGKPNYEFTIDEMKEAVTLSQSLDLEEQEKNWFVRYSLFYISNGEDMEKEKIYEDSQLRQLYEETWKDLASERYEVSLNESLFNELIERDLNAQLENPPEQMVNLAEALDYNIEEFLYKFEVNQYERMAISNDLIPKLEEEYNESNPQKIYQEYQQEVIREIVKNS